MKNLKSKKIIAVMVMLTSMIALTGCGSSDADDKTSSQSYSNAAVTNSEAATEENETKQNVVQTSTDVSIEGYPVKTVTNISGKGIQAIKSSDSMETISGSLFCQMKIYSM